MKYYGWDIRNTDDFKYVEFSFYDENNVQHIWEFTANQAINIANMLLNKALIIIGDE